MSKRNIVITVIVCLLTVFTVTAISLANSNEGYDTFKKIMKNQNKEEILNATVEANINLVDNASVSTMSALIKFDNNANKMNGNLSFDVNGIQRTAKIFKNQEDLIFVDTQNDLYYRAVADETCLEEIKMEHKKNRHENHKLSAKEEKLIDFLMRGYQKYFVLSKNEDGTQSIEFNLEEKNVPEILNYLIALDDSSDRHKNIEARKFKHEYSDIPFFDGLEDIHATMPKLEDEIKIKGIYFKISVNEKLDIIAGDFRFAIEGKDASGDFHDLVIEGKMRVSEINKSIIEEIDVTGKNVESINLPDCPKK